MVRTMSECEMSQAQRTPLQALVVGLGQGFCGAHDVQVRDEPGAAHVLTT